MNITENINRFKLYLYEEEKSQNTIEKYMRDIRAFFEYLGHGELTKQAVLEYKKYLSEVKAISSANSMIASINSYFRFLDKQELCVKYFKIQREAFCPAEKELTKEEYKRLVSTAKKRGNERLSLIIQTICGTGMRVSELRYITVENLKRGEIRVNCKGKIRTILLVKKLKKMLLDYTRKNGIKKGIVFKTMGDKPVSRTSIWRDMKALCEESGVSKEKTFPHNLRHLFARVFYSLEKDIAKLADILGHSSINTTRIYIVTTSKEHRHKMEQMRLIV